MEWLLDTAPAPPAPAPRLDAEQQRVVAHRSGPLLVLAGPGTGKTTTIVEAIASRLADGSSTPASVLALTFGRKAATELRDRVAARVGGGLVPAVATFHSFAYSLVRAAGSSEGFLDPPRLMSGAEEDVRIRVLLQGAVEDGSVSWPDDLEAALPTLGLANEVRAVLSRAREFDLDGEALQRIGREASRPAWVAIGELARQEQEVMLLENVMDYSELLVQALARASDPGVQAMLHARYSAIYVDEYQDTDPLQVALLRAIAGPAASVVAVGDPDQAIYTFRGADVGGLLRFPQQFPQGDGSPAPVAVLGTTRRFGPSVRSAAAAVLGDRLPAGLPVEQARRHRSPACEPVERDEVHVRVYDSRTAQAAHVAREIRLAHVRDGIAWHELAVLVRSGHQIPAVQRALSAAGVPVVVAADEIPLHSEPAVAALLAIVGLAARPERASDASVMDAIEGPVVGLSPTDVRRVGRALRAHVHRDGYAAPPSEQLIHGLVRGSDPGLWEALAGDDPVTVRLQRFSSLLERIHAQLVAGESPQAVLWTAWTGGSEPHGWPQRLRAAAVAGSRSAHHDLDAVMALFDAAERMTDRYPGFAGVRMFIDTLADQQIPAEPVAERGTRADAVRILTAHRAKGLEWREVWLIGVEEGVWPDLRARGSALHAEEITHGGIGPGPRAADLLDEERRLFYVACTRAREALHISAVDEQDSGGDRPSRFLDDVTRVLGGPDAALVHHPGRPLHPVSLDGLVAELRRTAMEPSADPALRSAAISRLADLASQVDDDGEPLVPAADPRTWWGLAELTPGATPVRDPQAPVALSGSSLDSMLNCPLQWFLDREARAETPRSTSTGFGSIVHAIADHVAKGNLAPDLEDLDAEIDRVWPALRFEAPWQSQAERAQARAALSRFLEYHLRADRELVSSEGSLESVVDVPAPGGGTDQVHLRGYVDRIERDAAGRLVPIDLKNIRSPDPDSSMAENGQLGVYQRMLQADGNEVGGAALVQLRVPASKDSPDPKVQTQEALTSQQPTWLDLKLGEAAAIVRDEAFEAQLGKSCRYCAFTRVCPSRAEGQQVIP